MKFKISEIEEFLKKVDKSFPTPLSQKQNLSEFALKLCEKATICEKREDGKIVAIVAGYTENIVDNIAYISVVATTESARGKGYSKELIKEFFEICKIKKIKAVHLYTARTNIIAINMYHKIGFVELIVENEPRKNDLHLIYYIKEINGL